MFTRAVAIVVVVVVVLVALVALVFVVGCIVDVVVAGYEITVCVFVCVYGFI